MGDRVEIGAGIGNGLLFPLLRGELNAAPFVEISLETACLYTSEGTMG